jgi:hypothetical protein
VGIETRRWDKRGRRDRPVQLSGVDRIRLRGRVCAPHAREVTGDFVHRPPPRLVEGAHCRELHVGVKTAPKAGSHREE